MFWNTEVSRLAAGVVLAMAVIGTGCLVSPAGEPPAPGGETPITADRFSRTYVSAINNSHHGRATFTLNAVPVPATMDLTTADGDEKGAKRLAVYELDGDRLIIHMGEPGRPRPEGLVSKLGSDSIRVVLRREK